MAKAKRDDLKIIGNGAAERARKKIKKNKSSKKSQLDAILRQTNLGIKKPKKGS